MSRDYSVTYRDIFNTQLQKQTFMLLLLLYTHNIFN